MTEVEVNSTLFSCVSEYMTLRNISKKKYLPGYLTAAKFAWRDLFQKTIYAVQSEWLPLRAGNPHPYVDVPSGIQRLFSVSVTNRCNKIVPLYYDNYANIIPEPTVSACGCGSCGCAGGLCDDIGGLTKLTKLLFTVSGIDYYEVTWLKICPNGDILEYRTVPTKSYNTFNGDGGDYNNDYNNDYLLENPPFTDFTIVTKEFQNVLCKLEVRPCGCPENTTENANLFIEHCGGYCQPFVRCQERQRLCKRANDTNGDECLGSVKLSECGTRIYYIPPPILNGQTPPRLPKYMLVNYQVIGDKCNSIVHVPEYSVPTMFFGIQYYSTIFNMSISIKDKKELGYMWTDKQNELILYSSNFSIEKLEQIQDIPIRF